MSKICTNQSRRTQRPARVQKEQRQQDQQSHAKIITTTAAESVCSVASFLCLLQSASSAILLVLKMVGTDCRRWAALPQCLFSVFARAELEFRRLCSCAAIKTVVNRNHNRNRNKTLRFIHIFFFTQRIFANKPSPTAPAEQSKCQTAAIG